MTTRVVKTQYNIHHYFWKFIDLLYPPICAGCEADGSRWCEDCHSSVEKIQHPFCEYCHQPISSGRICSTCKTNEPAFQRLRSWGIYQEPLRSAIHRLKYDRDISLGDVFSIFMVESIQKNKWKVDLVVPVPLNKQRLRARGYNQAAILARPLAFLLNVPFSTNSLKRVKNTVSQVGLSLQDRLENVDSAFQANPKRVQDRTILVIDDVCTSGATINACSKSLIDAGAKDVYGYTLARAIRLE